MFFCCQILTDKKEWCGAISAIRIEHINLDTGDSPYCRRIPDEGYLNTPKGI